MTLNVKCPPFFKAAIMAAAVHTVCPGDAVNITMAQGGNTFSSSTSRGRVVLSNGTIVTDRGTLLRGCRVSTDMTERLPERSAISSIKRYGLNAIHLYAESFVNHKPGQLHALVDTLVAWTGRDSLYLVLTIGCIDQNGHSHRDFTAGFWNFYAPRYAGQTHVVYEIHNEPHAWSPPYPDSTLGMELDAYKIIRSHAPSTHVLFFSYAVPNNSAGILQDIRKLGAEVDWGNSSIATHGYGVTYDVLEGVIRDVRNAGYGVINTEPCFMQLSDRGSIDLFRQQIRMHEDNHVSYLHFQDADELQTPGHFKNIIENAGISWEPDFGTWPAPVIWNAFSRMEAEYYSSQGGPSGVIDLGNKIGYASGNDFIAFDSVDFGEGASMFRTLAASGGIGGTVDIRLDSLTGFPAGQVQIAPTGGWDAWRIKTCKVNGMSGVHQLFLRFTGGEQDLFDIDWFQFTPVSTAAGREPGETASPETVRLGQNYPNPFNSNTAICFALSEPADISLSIFDLQGRKLLNLADGKYQPGEYALIWPSGNLSSGIYIYRLTAGPFRETRKMIIQK